MRIVLSGEEPVDVERALQVARTLRRTQQSWRDTVSAYAVRQLLPLKNET
jgi:hypothetical protein